MHGSSQLIFEYVVKRFYVVGEITSDGLGYPARSGPSYKNGSRQGCGGGHGGNGGRALYQLQSSLAYDSLYMPKEKGSGGGGESGGGIVYINVTNIFRLEGNVRANGLRSNNGGGAGGTVVVWTNNFDGMGTIESKGGDGAVRGGGGAGGRIAVYHSGISTFIGSLEAFGGESMSEKGGPGTVYVQDGSGNATRRQLTIDNGHFETSSKLNEIRQVVLAGNPVSSNYGVTSYTSPGDILLSTSGPPYSKSGQISNLFSGTGNFYYTMTSKPTITYTFPYPLTIDHARIFPQCNSAYWTNFRVEGYLKNTVVYNQTTWTETTFCRSGQYGRDNIQKEVDKVWKEERYFS